jgi:hypothetical protein
LVVGDEELFSVAQYSSHAEGRNRIYQLKGKVSMWWDQFVQVQQLNRRRSLGGSSKIIFKINTYPSIIMIGI